MTMTQEQTIRNLQAVVHRLERDLEGCEDFSLRVVEQRRRFRVEVYELQAEILRLRALLRRAGVEDPAPRRSLRPPSLEPDPPPSGSEPGRRRGEEDK